MAMIIYFMWSGKHPLEEFDSVVTINDEISKGTRPILPLAMPSPVRDIVREMWSQQYKLRPTILQCHIAFEDLISSCLSDKDEIDSDTHIQMNPLTDSHL